MLLERYLNAINTTKMLLFFANLTIFCPAGWIPLRCRDLDVEAAEQGDAVSSARGAARQTDFFHADGQRADVLLFSLDANCYPIGLKFIATFSLCLSCLMGSIK